MLIQLMFIQLINCLFEVGQRSSYKNAKVFDSWLARTEKDTILAKGTIFYLRIDETIILIKLACVELLLRSSKCSARELISLSRDKVIL